MTDPSLTFQTAVRTALINDPAVIGLVAADQIREGSTKPEHFPTIILANPQIVNLGSAGGGYRLARVYIDLHIWALDGGENTARHIGAAVSNALWDAPCATSNDVDSYVRPSFTFMRDPDPERAYCHGVGSVAGVVRW